MPNYIARSCPAEVNWRVANDFPEYRNIYIHTVKEDRGNTYFIDKLFLLYLILHRISKEMYIDFKTMKQSYS